MIICVLTFTAIRRNLSEGVVTAVTLASDHTGLTLTLAALSVTRSGEGADRVAVAQQAGVAAFRTVVVVLETGLGRRSADLQFLFKLIFWHTISHLKGLTSCSCLFNNIWLLKEEFLNYVPTYVFLMRLQLSPNVRLHTDSKQVCSQWTPLSLLKKVSRQTKSVWFDAGGLIK